MSCIVYSVAHFGCMRQNAVIWAIFTDAGWQKGAFPSLQYSKLRADWQYLIALNLRFTLTFHAKKPSVFLSSRSEISLERLTERRILGIGDLYPVFLYYSIFACNF